MNFKILISSFLLLATGSAYAIEKAESAKPSDKPAAQVFDTVKIPIEGMTCMSCVASIKNSIKKLDGVTSAEVSLVERSIKVSFLSTKTSAQKISDKIIALGYKTGPWPSEGK